MLMAHQLFEITQSAVLQNSKGEVLILQHKSGPWLLPGGRINEGESWLDALKREVKEETGSDDFSVTRILDADSFTDENKAKYTITFLCSTPGFEVRLSGEHQALAWVTKETFGDYEYFHENIKKRIAKAFE